jgi:PAT family beta-lactamase induction signal transducer AmpG
VLSTYFAEGLPFSVVRQLTGEFLTSMGEDPKKIGATSLYGLAWNLKLLWSPFLDHYGRLRRWLWVMEALVGLAVLALAGPAGAGHTRHVWQAVMVVAVLAATHDVAIDGFYMEALDKDAQVRFTGLRPTAYKAALLAGKGLLVLAGALQAAGWDKPRAWRVTYAAAGAALLLLAFGHALALPRPRDTRVAGAPKPRYVDAFLSLWAQPKMGISLAFIVAYKAGDALMFAMNAPFLKSLGFGDLFRGSLGSVAMVAGMVAALASGPIIAKVGLRRALGPIAAVQSLAILGYVAVAALRPGMTVTAVVAIVEQVVGGIGDVALAVFLMRRCGTGHKAAHFAILSALMSLGSTVAGVASGYLLAPLGYPRFFALAFLVSLPGVALTRWVPKD